MPGRKLLQSVKPNSGRIKIPTADLKTGIYLLTASDGIIRVSKKIIKE